MSQSLPRSIASWLLINGWTEPQLIDSTWFAFPPNAPMPIAVPYMATGVDPYYCGILLINLHYGSLRYWLNSGAITCSQWLPSREFCLQHPQTEIVLGLDLLEINGQTVTFRVHGDRLIDLRSLGWQPQLSNEPGIVVKAQIFSVQYLQEVLA